MNKKYIVRLTDEERAVCEMTIKHEKGRSEKLRRAAILLKADADGPGWKDEAKPIIVHRWRWSGWWHARQLRGENGRWIVWANAAEARRLGRLRAFELAHHGRRPPPANLTTPAKRGGSVGQTTRTQSGGN